MRALWTPPLLRQRVNVFTFSPTEVLSCLLAGFTPGLAGFTVMPRPFTEFCSFSWKKLARKGNWWELKAREKCWKEPLGVGFNDTDWIYLYLTDSYNVNQFFIKSVSVLFKETFALIFHLLIGQTILIISHLVLYVLKVSTAHLVCKVLNDKRQLCGRWGFKEWVLLMLQFHLF